MNAKIFPFNDEELNKRGKQAVDVKHILVASSKMSSNTLDTFNILTDIKEHTFKRNECLA